MREEASELKGIKKHSNYFKKIWGKSKPIVRLFQTEYGGYLYDAGTNKILGCEDLVFKLLVKLLTKGIDEAINEVLAVHGKEKFLNALEKIVKAIEKEKVLLSTSEGIYFGSEHFKHLREMVDGSLNQLVLETTESCNFRCNYCIYSSVVPESRIHGTKHMDLSTAFAAIDYMVAHSSQYKGPSLNFYGGEPLLRFAFIKSCVEYYKKARKGKKVRFAITTNGTLVTPDIAEFLAKEKFSVLLSIDGPREIHDSWRVDMNGAGTFSRTIEGLKMLVDAFGDAAKQHIILSMVYTPPYSEKKIDRIAQLWDEYPWIGELTPSITYPYTGSIPPEKIPDRNAYIEDKSFMEWVSEKYISDYKNKKESHPLVKTMVVKALTKIFHRPIFDEPFKGLYLNGCCLPAVRRVFITVDGDMALCERIHNNAPFFGNVHTGIDFERLKSVYVNEYGSKSLPICAKCWANRLCGICYIHTYSDGHFDINKKEERCGEVRFSIEEALKLYTILLKIDPEGLNYMADIELS
jgi:uncharacterized protein